jgi:glycosyltransferase involved in cell wall biosynthesis
VTIALDATYSIGNNLSGVGLYSSEILHGVAEAHPEVRFEFCYRPHRYMRARAVSMPQNARRRLLAEPFGPRSADLFHGLNQRLPRMRLRRTVVTFHDLFVMTGEYSTPEFRARFTEQARDAARRADAVIGVSEFTKSQVVSLLDIPAGQIHVIHHGVRKLDYPEMTRERVILCVGAIQKRKNIARLIDAFRTVDRSWELVLTGAAGYGAEEILRDLPPRVTVTGYISEQQLAQWYRRAMIFAFPSLDEGFGMPVLEAMAAGTPVLTSNRSALPEVAGDAALLVDPEDTQAIAEALRNLTQDEDLRLDLARRGKDRASRFTWDQAVRETWRVYSGLL